MRKEASTNSINDNFLRNFCNSYKILSTITGRWKVPIIFSLEKNSKNYSELKTEISNLTDRILTKQLKELTLDGIVENQKTKTNSSYILSPKGQKMLAILQYINHIEI